MAGVSRKPKIEAQIERPEPSILSMDSGLLGLVARSHEFDIEHQLTPARSGCERPSYRLSKSEFAGHLQWWSD